MKILPETIGEYAFNEYLKALTKYNPELRVVDGNPRKLNKHISYLKLMDRPDEFWKIIKGVMEQINNNLESTES